MSEFKVGDKVRILGNMKKTGTEGFIESVDNSGNSLAFYNIKDINGNVVAENISENILESLPITKFEKVMMQFSNPLGLWEYFIPDNVTDDISADNFFKEMAEIYPKYNEEHNIKKNRFKVCVFEGNEGPIPHVHIYFEHKGSKEDVAYVCLGKAEYAPQHIKETKILNTHERKALQEFFNTKIPNVYGRKDNGEFYQKTCWQACVEHWIDENTDFEKYFELDKNTGLYIMPDYSKLNLNN